MGIKRTVCKRRRARQQLRITGRRRRPYSKGDVRLRYYYHTRRKRAAQSDYIIRFTKRQAGYIIVAVHNKTHARKETNNECKGKRK